MEQRWLAVLDPPARLKPETDTTLAIIEAAGPRGICVDTAQIEDLFVQQTVQVNAVGVSGERHPVPLDEYSLILMRKEPPYDLAFHYATQLLSLTSTPVVNSPSALRDFNEKLIALHFASVMPPTLVASDPVVLGDFVAQQGGRCVLKALDSFQGRSVALVEEARDPQLRQFTDNGRRPVMVQRFLDAVYDGDKRVLLLGDRVLGAVLRRPRQGFHANFAKSEALVCSLTPAEQDIITRVGPWLVERGIHFTGLDFIGEHLTEINITCPTGVKQIGMLEGRDLAGDIVEYLIDLSRGGDRHDRAGT